MLEQQYKKIQEEVDVENFPPEVRRKVAQLKIETRLKQLQEIRFFQPAEETEEENSEARFDDTDEQKDEVEE